MVRWPHLHNGLYRTRSPLHSKSSHPSSNLLCSRQHWLPTAASACKHPHCRLELALCLSPRRTAPISAAPRHLTQSLQHPHVLTLTHTTHFHSQTHTAKSMPVHTRTRAHTHMHTRSLHQRKPSLTLQVRKTSRAGTTFQRSGKQESRKYKGGGGRDDRK